MQVAGDRREVLAGQHALQGQALLAHRLDDRLLADLDRFLAALLVEELPDLRTRRGALDEAQPVLRRAGVADFDVKISMTSPLDSVDSSGTSLPLTRAPMHLCPTWVCTAYAKSTGSSRWAAGSRRPSA
jgi:hypothetical protein